MQTFLKTAAFAAAALGLATASNAAVLLSDNFSYPNGPLVTTPANDGWNTHSGTTGQVMVNNGTIGLVQTTNSEDVNAPLSAAQTTGDTFGAFDFSNAGGSSTVYFAHFFSTSTVFRSRVFIAAPVAGGDYTLGITATAGTPVDFLPFDLTFGTTYRPVISYNAESGLSTLTLNGTTITSTDTAAGTPDHRLRLS